MDLKAMIDSLSDIGCSTEQEKKAKMLYESGQKAELIRYLKCCRCSLVDEMHESQRKVDRIDYLIRKAEKETV
jgi:HD superfamily phosphohydrolase